MKRGKWTILFAGGFVLACQSLLDFTPRNSEERDLPDATDASTAETNGDSGNDSDASIVDAAIEACAHTFCDDFEDTTTLLERWKPVERLGSIDAGIGNGGSQGLRCVSQAVADASSTERRAYVQRTYELDGGAQTLRAKVALDCSTRLDGKQYVLVLGITVRDPSNDTETAEAFFVRHRSSDGGNERAILQISGVDGSHAEDIEDDPLPSQWIDVSLEIKLNAGAWAKGGSAGKVSARWTEISPTRLEHRLDNLDLTALVDRDGRQVVDFRAGIEYLADGTGESVNIGIDDVELDLE
jgi:hypothetical protein